MFTNKQQEEIAMFTKDQRNELIDALEYNILQVETLSAQVKQKISEGDAQEVHYLTRELVAAETKLNLNRSLLKM